jgi:hypothetical protein
VEWEITSGVWEGYEIYAFLFSDSSWWALGKTDAMALSLSFDLSDLEIEGGGDWYVALFYWSNVYGWVLVSSSDAFTIIDENPYNSICSSISFDDNEAVLMCCSANDDRDDCKIPIGDTDYFFWVSDMQAAFSVDMANFCNSSFSFAGGINPGYLNDAGTESLVGLISGSVEGTLEQIVGDPLSFTLVSQVPSEYDNVTSMQLALTATVDDCSSTSVNVEFSAIGTVTVNGVVYMFGVTLGPAQFDVEDLLNALGGSASGKMSGSIIASILVSILVLLFL